MKIAILFDNFGPYHLARLNAAGQVCDVMGIELAPTSVEYAWQREPASQDFRGHTLLAERERSQCDSRTLSQRLGQVLAEFGPDTVAIPGWSSRLAFTALAWCVKHRVPSILMSESTETDETRTGWKELVKRRYVATCGAGLVGGERHREYLVKLGMPAEKIHLGYDAVDNDYFKCAAATIRRAAAEHRRRLNLPERYFLSSARFIAKKNLTNLLEAYARYRDECVASDATTRPWDLVLLGDGELRAELESRRAQLRLESAVHMPGFKQYDELPGYYALAGAFVHASVVEPWGLVVNEAMASSLPILVSDRCGCTPTLLKEGENGCAFDPTDVGSMADCLIRITRMPDSTRHKMGRKSASIIAAFGPPRFADGLRQAALDASRPHTTPSPTINSVLLQMLLHSRD